MSASARRRSLAAVSVPVCAVGVNALAYLLLLLAARRLDHANYGEMVTLLGVLLVGSVPALALQTVTARRIAAGIGTSGVGTATVVLAAGSAAALAALSVPLDRFLHMGTSAGMLWVAAALVGTTWFGPLLGLAQGGRRFGALAGMTVLQGVGRSGGGLAGLLMGHTPCAAIAGVAAGTAVAAVFATAVARLISIIGSRTAELPSTLRGVLVEAAHAAHGHGAFLALASVDLLLARHVLTGDDAGLYAAGTVVERTALWLPQSVGLLVFARMAGHAQHRRTVRLGGVLITAIGLALIACVAAGGGLVVTVIGGQYHRLAGIAWLFAVIGASLAITQFAVLAGLAMRRSRRILLLWVAMAVEVAGVLAQGGAATPTRVAITTAVVMSASAAVTFAVAARYHPSGDAGGPPVLIVEVAGEVTSGASIDPDTTCVPFSQPPQTRGGPTGKGIR